MEEQKLEFWAIIELFGHTTIAGHLQPAGELIRIDVPETDDQQAFTKYYGLKAVYGITPTTEKIARRAAKNLQARPVQLYLVSEPGQTAIEFTDEQIDEEIPY